jgi:hypothetical protein
LEIVQSFQEKTSGDLHSCIPDESARSEIPVFLLEKLFYGYTHIQRKTRCYIHGLGGQAENHVVAVRILVFGTRCYIAINENISEVRHKDPPIKREGIDPHPELGLREELTPKEIMVEIIIGGQVKDPGIIGKTHSPREDL